MSRLAYTVALVAIFAAGSAAAQMPDDPAAAARQFEQEVELRKWADGPVRYLFTDEEDDIWKELANDEQRRDFIAWFWDRRDDELRDRQRPFLEGFYTRVAGANGRFSGFPRGWRSDRGRAWIVFGQPDGIRSAGLGTEVWVYNTYGGILKSSSVMGQMEVGFREVDVGKWQIAGGIGPGAWPSYVLRAIDLVNEAQIVNPELEWKR